MDRFDLDRLAKILGMAASAHEGEALAAVRQADAMLRSAGLTWLGLMGSLQEIARLRRENEALKAELERRSSQLPALRRPPRDHRELALRLIMAVERGLMRVNGWELTFLESLTAFNAELSGKQRATLHRLVERAKAAAKAAGDRP
jgi:hypothetical protein